MKLVCTPVWLLACFMLHSIISCVGAETGTCSKSTPCESGCCSKSGHCGFGPDFCEKGCISGCDRKAECGKYAAQPGKKCPLNVCCSQYGFCGTIESYCGDGCQSGCDAITEPSCSGTSSEAIYVGYYEGWNPSTRKCDILLPENINVNPWTHLYYSFAGIDNKDFTITPTNRGDEGYWKQFTALKEKKPSLKTYISVGGWDLGGKIFSDMVSSAKSRKAFIDSAVKMMTQFGFDGIDIDWEYPAASDRGGVAADTANLVTFMSELRQALGKNRGITATLPSAYWYLKGFDIFNMQKYVDHFNFMSYDIHGTWDGKGKGTSAVVNPHTDLTEISEGLDLLWRNKIDPKKVLLGLGFYGRSFTLSDPKCTQPGCPFYTGHNNTGGGVAGQCTDTIGILSDYEIKRIIDDFNVKVQYDKTASVNWMTWAGNQWVSFDNARTLKEKADFANRKCLAGLFSWAIDLGGPGTLTNPNSLNASDQSMSGASTNGGSDSSGDMYVGPEVFGPSPTIKAIPPVNIIFPPSTLATPTVIKPEWYPTSIEVAWPTTKEVVADGTTSTVSTIHREIVNTTIPVPDITTSALHFWGWNISVGVSTGHGSLTPSVDIPDVTITDKYPSSVPGPPPTRVIHFPPWPWTTSSGTPYPAITFKSGGPPSPTCTKNCGHGCSRFCDGPCLVNCGSSSSHDFPDPSDPDPPDSSKCVGADCKNGKCTGPLCILKGCSGNDCQSGICVGDDCVPSGCTGSDCHDGHCRGSNCQSHGCIGSDCNSGSSGRCFGLDCLSWGCIGLDCSSSSSTCSGSNCRIVSCTGSNCVDGICTGNGCQSQDRDDCEEKKAELCTEWISSTLVTPASTHQTSTITSNCQSITACSAKPSTVTSTVNGELTEGVITELYGSSSDDPKVASTVNDYWQTYWSIFAANKTTTSTTTTTTTTKTTSTPTSSTNPNIPNAFLIFKYEEHTVYFDTSEKHTYSWYGDYYSYMQQTTRENVCDNAFKVVGPIDAASSSRYPSSLGPFDLPAQYYGCTYSGTDSSLGSVKCGDQTFSCSGVGDSDSDTVTYDCGKTTADGDSTYIYHHYNEVMQCSITY